MPYIPYSNFLPPTHVTHSSALGPQAHTLPPQPPPPPPCPTRLPTNKPGHPKVSRHLTPIQLRNTLKKVASTSQHIDAAFPWRPSILETKNAEDILMEGPSARALAARPVEVDGGMKKRRQPRRRPNPDAVNKPAAQRRRGSARFTPAVGGAAGDAVSGVGLTASA